MADESEKNPKNTHSLNVILPFAAHWYNSGLEHRERMKKLFWKYFLSLENDVNSMWSGYTEQRMENAVAQHTNE